MIGKMGDVVMPGIAGEHRNARPAPPSRAVSMSWALSPTMAISSGLTPVVAAKLQDHVARWLDVVTQSAAMTLSKSSKTPRWFR